MRSLLLSCLAVVAGHAVARSPDFVTQHTPGVQREEGEARWTELLERNASGDCADKSLPAAFRTGRPSNQPIRADADDCVENVLVVRSDSERPIQCHLRLEQESADEGGKTLSEVDYVIYPGITMSGPGSYARANPAPKSYGAKCWLIPGPALPKMDVPEECKVNMRVPSPQDFYPPGSIRRTEEGDVTIEFGVVEGSSRPGDVRVVVVSGFPDLDNATLKLATHIRVTGGCPGQRYRLMTRFKLAEQAPAAN